MSAVQHTPLDRSTRQIRLLSFVEIGAHTGLICCRLDTYDLDHCPSFVALSYTWGDVHSSREIILNEEVFSVRQNLHSALSVLGDWDRRDRGHWRNSYWIDAICINQQDDSERSHQVNMMGTIYSEASSVLVWLGPGDVDSDRALEKAAAYCALPRKSRREMNLTQINLTQFIRQSGIATSAYWERMWVIQEFTLAQDIVLLQGHSKLRFEGLEPNLPVMPDAIAGAMKRLVDGRKRWGQRRFLPTSGTTLELLISMFQSSKYSDVRDRVYALLSLVQVRPDDSKPLYPDYTISPRQLYYRVLSNVRHSPSLRDTTDWDEFRALLCRILVIPRDKDFERNDFLYRVSGDERRGVKSLFLHPDHRAELRHAKLGDVVKYLHWPLAHVDWDPERIYKDIIQAFQQFPKEEDPEAWICFDKLFKEALGLRSTTGKDSGMRKWLFFSGNKLLSQGSGLG